MGKIRWGRGVLAVWLGAAAGPISEAKPPDLPAKADVRCEEGVEPDARPLRLLPQSEADESAPASLDGWWHCAMPVVLQQLCQRLFAAAQPGAGEVVPPRDASTADVIRVGGLDVGTLGTDNSATAEQARRLYELASRCARQGKLDEARARLREAHLANPTCRFGQLAIQRLQELEATVPVEEPSEPVPPRAVPKPPSSLEEQQEDEPGQAERTFQRVRQVTQPLGLVPGTTY